MGVWVSSIARKTLGSAAPFALKFRRDAPLLATRIRESAFSTRRGSSPRWIIPTSARHLRDRPRRPTVHLFHAMPLYEGETLKARIAREGALPFADALRIAGQIAQGLAAAHRAGVVHRDLKPANVMLLPDGTVKILDFGLAKVSDVSLTGSSTMLGTVSYMAPEQVHGREARRAHRPVGARRGAVRDADREPGHSPGEHGRRRACDRSRRTRRGPPRSAARSRSELDDLLHTALRKDPAQRHQSADELATAMAAVRLDESPSAARRRRVLRRWRRGVSRHAKVLAPAALAAVISGGWLANRTLNTPDGPLAVAVLPSSNRRRVT